MTNETQKIIEQIRDELQKGINRNDVLPLDWAMDRITPIIEKALELQREEFNSQRKKDKNDAQDVVLSGDTNYAKGKNKNTENMPSNEDNHSDIIKQTRKQTISEILEIIAIEINRIKSVKRYTEYEEMNAKSLIYILESIKEKINNLK